MDSAIQLENQVSTEQNKLKNLEGKVDNNMLSKEESDDDVIIVESQNTPIEVDTPKQTALSTNATEVQTPRRAAVLQEALQTPRRSVRKSVKPLQDYDEIVSKRTLRSTTKENKITVDAIVVVEADAESDLLDPQPKWIAAEVGRVSQKRGRKNRRVASRKSKQTAEANEVKDVEKAHESASEQTNEKEECVEVKPSPLKVAEKKKYLDLKSVNLVELGLNLLDSEDVGVELSKDNNSQKPQEPAVPDDSVVITGVDGKIGDVDGGVNDDDSDCSMQPLLVSDEDDEDPQQNAPPLAVPVIVLTTPKTNMKKSHPKAYRFPTPYKCKEKVEIQTEDAKDLVVEVEKKPDEVVKNEFIVDIKPIISINKKLMRKRSQSLCEESTDAKRKPRTLNRVTFNSPANQTTVIEDLDLLIKKSVQKQNKNKALPLSAAEELHVTKRRKRSMSFDDKFFNSTTKWTKQQTSSWKSGTTSQKLGTASEKLCTTPQKPGTTPKKLGTTPQKLGTTPQKPVLTRTKLPNFAYIHEKHFNKMENLVDHVTRKAERAKVLTNSSTKLQTGTEPTCAPPRPSTPRLAVIRPLNLDGTTSMAPITAAKTVKTRSAPGKRIMPTKAQLKDAPVPKSTFNLSTMVNRSTTINTSRMAVPTADASTGTNDKVATRRERHMQMFKGRTAAASAQKSNEMIRGVRSNRRFELQMQHRRNMEMDH